MIDEDWLKTLQFNSTNGLIVNGLEGLGSEKVVLNATLPDGKRAVLQVYRHHLGFHIREIPLFLSDNKPLYTVNKVNKKLLSLMGNPLLDGWTSEYDRLYCSLIKILHEFGLEKLMLTSVVSGMEMMSSFIDSFDLKEAVSFIIHTPGMKRRLQDWATLPEKYDNPSEAILSINGPNFPFFIPRLLLIQWAKGLLEKIDEITPSLKPSELQMNPLYIWGAAVMDGFFTDEELPKVIDFLSNQFGPINRMPRAVIYFEQAKALAYLLSFYLKESKVQRFVEFCNMLGFKFQIRKDKF